MSSVRRVSISEGRFSSRAFRRAYRRPRMALHLALGISVGAALELSVSQVDAQVSTPSVWAGIKHPSAEAPQVHGKPQAGCVSGAIPLPENRQLLRLMRPERNRHYGHPNVVDAVQRLARHMSRTHGVVLLVGDLSQPRGGPMPYGHRSHQSGLDADIRYQVLANPDLPTPTETATVLRTKHDVAANRWTPVQTDLLRTTALAPETDRIFVNPAIKRNLCKQLGTTPNADWLSKIRPWWGHDRHFHVRLKCPKGSMTCIPQDPVPPGRGCGASLDWWFQDHDSAVTGGAPKRPAIILPTACAGVMTANPRAE